MLWDDRRKSVSHIGPFLACQRLGRTPCLRISLGLDEVGSGEKTDGETGAGTWVVGCLTRQGLVEL